MIEDEKQSKHTGLIVMALFNLLGWGVSEEKDAGFLSVARVLGVCIDLTEVDIKLMKIYNTEVRNEEIKVTANDILHRGSLKKGELQSLRGRLVFGENQGLDWQVVQYVNEGYIEVFGWSFYGPHSARVELCFGCFERPHCQC